MKRQQSGFTLIELVVVIVLLGILAAAAIPRFAGLTEQARGAVADGIVGAILSSAVIQYGASQGEPVPFQTIIENTGIDPGTNAVFIDIDGEGFEELGSVTNLCQDTGGTGNVVEVRVCASGADDEDDASCQSRTGTIPDSLCEIDDA